MRPAVPTADAIMEEAHGLELPEAAVLLAAHDLATFAPEDRELIWQALQTLDQAWHDLCDCVDDAVSDAALEARARDEESAR